MRTKKLKLAKRNKGLFHERTKYKGYPPRSGFVNYEKIMQKLWNQENHPTANRGINFGFGVLQDLFVAGPERKPGEFPKEDNIKLFTTTVPTRMAVYKITDREHIIAATLMQWLGSPIGFGFVERFVEKCGYKLIKSAKC